MTEIQSNLLKKLAESGGELKWKYLTRVETSAGTALARKRMATWWPTMSNKQILSITNAGRAAIEGDK